jgi:hypothetical protein
MIILEIRLYSRFIASSMRRDGAFELIFVIILFQK